MNFLVDDALFLRVRSARAGLFQFFKQSGDAISVKEKIGVISDPSAPPNNEDVDVLSPVE